MYPFESDTVSVGLENDYFYEYLTPLRLVDSANSYQLDEPIYNQRNSGILFSTFILLKVKILFSSNEVPNHTPWFVYTPSAMVMSCSLLYEHQCI